jgi:hypothetical protein
MAGQVACMREKKNVCRVLVGKPEGRPTSRWKNNKMDLKGLGWSMDWIK